MALQVQRCMHWHHDPLQVAFKPPWQTKGGTQKTRQRSHIEEDLRSTNEFLSGSNAKVSLSDRLKGLPAHFVATPRYSSLLRVSRHRRHELKMETRDRVFSSISDWVFRRVNDPMVEIDPLTVNEAIKAENEAEQELANGLPAASAASTVASTSSYPSRFGYLPPGFPNGAKGVAFAIGVVLLLTALATTAILAFLRNKKSAVQVVAKRNGSARGNVNNRAGTSFSDTECDKAVFRGQPAVDSQNQSSSLIPSYSSALEQSDLPLPPSLSFSERTDKMTPPVSKTLKKVDSGPNSEAPEDNLVLSFTVPVKDRAPSEADVTLKIEEVLISANKRGTSAKIVPEVSAMESHESASSSTQSLATGDVLALAVLIEGKNGLGSSLIQEHSSSEPVVELRSAAAEPVVELRSAAEPVAHLPSATKPVVAELPSAAEPVAKLPSAAGPLAELPSAGPVVGLLSASEPVAELTPIAESVSEITQASDEEVYLLLGNATSLCTIGKLPPAEGPIAALPDADHEVPLGFVLSEEKPNRLSTIEEHGVAKDLVLNSILEEKSSALQHPNEEEIPSELVGFVSAAAQEGLPVGSILFEEPDCLPPAQEFRSTFETQSVAERRRAYSQMLKKILPAASVGAGAVALSSFSGVDGALQVVGFLAAASFLARDILWANQREQLLKEIHDIKDHKQLIGFLKRKSIIPDSWNQ